MNDAFRTQLMRMNYNDIINSCQAKLIEVCDDPNFWLEKMKWEIDYYNVSFYNEYEFLRQALKLRHKKYFQAYLSKSQLIPSDK